MPAKSLALLPFSFSSHSAAAACKACERTRKGGRQHGTTEPCRRPVRCRRHARCSARRRSRCSRRFSSRTSSRCRSDADMTTFLPLPTRAPVLTHCICTLCMLLCRCGAGVEWGRSTPSIQRRAAVRALRTTAEPLQGKAVCLPAWQVLPALLRRSASCCPSGDEAATHEASLRHSAADAAMEAAQAGACSSRRSAAASRLPSGRHPAPAHSLSGRVDPSPYFHTRSHPQRSFAAHSLRAVNDQV
jgi:hypothetical protein